MARAIAYFHGPERVVRLAQAFQAGCNRHGVPCEVRAVEAFTGPEPADVVWMYGLGSTMAVFRAYEGRARRLVGDVGYWRELMKLARPDRYSRVAVDAQQPDGHLRLRPHLPDRFQALQALGLRRHEPVDQRGDHILLCGYSAAQAGKFGVGHGQWERAAVERIRAVTDRPILTREKPKNPLDIPGTTRCEEASCWLAIRSAWAVVCRSGNIGADCILHGVPCFAESGPGAVYHRRPLNEIDAAAPLEPDERLAALSDLAYWQWQPAEIERGLLWENLRCEGIV